MTKLVLSAFLQTDHFKCFEMNINPRPCDPDVTLHLRSVVARGSYMCSSLIYVYNYYTGDKMVKIKQVPEPPVGEKQSRGKQL